MKLESIAPVLSFDFEGHGRSPLSSHSIGKPGDIQEYVECLRAFLEGHSIGEDRPACLIAHGEGAFVVSFYLLPAS